MSITVGFSDDSRPGPSGPITAWAWDFGDGGTSTSQNPTHAYAAAGTYSVTLTVTGTGADGTDSVTRDIPVLASPATVQADFTSAPDGGNSLLIHFTDASTAGPSGPITAWSWTFGDGGTSTSQNPSHTYAGADTYTVTLTVTGTSPDGTAMASKSVTVVSGGGGGTTHYRPYTDTSTFNKKIPASPAIHANTSQMISATDHWLLGGTSDDQFKEWLGPRPRCLYFRGDTSTLTKVPVYVNFVAGTGYVCASSPKLQMPMPSWFPSILTSNSVSGDLIVVVVDSNTGDLWEAWKITPPGMASRNITCASNRWNAITCNHFAADTISHTGYDAASAVSESYIHMPAGLMIPEDFADLSAGSVIPHAIGFITRTDSHGDHFPRFVPPARAGIGSEPYGIPYGGRVQLDPSLNVDTWPSVNTRTDPWKSALKKILRTMQQYGMVLMDGTGGIGAGGLAACHPASVVHGTYNGSTGFIYPWDGRSPYSIGVPYDLMSHFRVIDWNVWTGV